MAGNGEEHDVLMRLVLKLDARLDPIEKKVDLGRAEARARIDALRLELLDDLQTVLRFVPRDT